MVQNNKYLMLIWLISLISMMYSCKKKHDINQQQIYWTGSEPLTIPYRIRHQKYVKGNLVLNPSFESGKVFAFDSTGLTFNIDGWKKIGDNIEWVNTDSSYHATEVFHGTHSVKIQRSNPDETDDQGEGIISDFIKVIPGNFLFTFYTKLEDIESNRKRIGLKIHDAVDVRLLFFDKNKIQISGETYCPPLERKIDNSFKGYSFSNFWEINQMDWSQIIGRTYNYPFSDGDIPDEAKYVKIFIGLKGSGTLWIDSVDFRYSKNNLTPLERVSDFFDSTFTSLELIHPTPKHVVKRDSIDLIIRRQGETRLPVIVVPSLPNNMEQKVSLMLKKELTDKTKDLADSLYKNKIEIVSKLAHDKDQYPVIFSIGNTPIYQSNKKFLDSILNSLPQTGYFIELIEEKAPVVVINSKTQLGTLYGIQTVIQLIDQREPIFHGASIIDYPDYSTRSVYVNGDLDINPAEYESFLDNLTHHRINRLYTKINGNQSKGNIILQEQLATRNRKCKIIEYGAFLEFQWMEKYKGKLKEEITDPTNFLNSIHVKQMNDILSSYSQPDLSGIILSTENVILHKYRDAYDKNDLDFILDLSDFHSSFLNQTGKIVTKINPDIDIYFIPPWSNNKIIDTWNNIPLYYFFNLHQNIVDIHMLWTGTGSMSVRIDDADFKHFSKVTFQKPVLMDRSKLAKDPELNISGYFDYYPGKRAMGNLFQPYDVFLPDHMHRKSGKPEIILQDKNITEFNKISIATFADYCWNTSGYDAELSLLKILISRFGIEASKYLYLFNNAYFSLFDICERIQEKGINQKIIKQAEYDIVVLNINHKKLKNSIKNNQYLIQELFTKKENIINRYYKLYENSLVNKKLQEDSSLFPKKDSE